MVAALTISSSSVSYWAHSMPYGLFLFAAWITSVKSIDSRDKWSSVFDTTLYTGLPSCAKPCLANVDSQLSCWSYGCVCSENTLGTNFINGTNYIQNCVRTSCPQSNQQVINDALNAFQSTCGVRYLSVTGTATVTMTPTLPAVVTPTFDTSKAVLIDAPDSFYSQLTPCLRWVLNVCQSPKDNAENCKPNIQVDHSKIWNGLGRYLQCSTAECVCAGSSFFYSLQKFYERADLYCSIGFPYQDSETNIGFETTVSMLVQYCSVEAGVVIDKWMLTLMGYVPQTGLSQETKVSIGVGVGSGVLTVISIILAYLTLRKK